VTLILLPIPGPLFLLLIWLWYEGLCLVILYSFVLYCIILHCTVLYCIVFCCVSLIYLVGLLISEGKQKISKSGEEGTWKREQEEWRMENCSQTVLCERRIHFKKNISLEYVNKTLKDIRQSLKMMEHLKQSIHETCKIVFLKEMWVNLKVYVKKGSPSLSTYQST